MGSGEREPSTVLACFIIDRPDVFLTLPEGSGRKDGGGGGGKRGRRGGRGDGGGERGGGKGERGRGGGRGEWRGLYSELVNVNVNVNDLLQIPTIKRLFCKKKKY